MLNESAVLCWLDFRWIWALCRVDWIDVECEHYAVLTVYWWLMRALYAVLTGLTLDERVMLCLRWFYLSESSMLHWLWTNVEWERYVQLTGMPLNESAMLCWFDCSWMRALCCVNCVLMLNESTMLCWLWIDVKWERYAVLTVYRCRMRPLCCWLCFDVE